MIGERELIALLYRADWTRLSLSGEVYGIDERLLSTIMPIHTHMADSGEPFPPPEFGAARPNVTRLLLAPGRRYREDSADGPFTAGSDGERAWIRVEEPLSGPEDEVRFSGGPEPPFPALLCPSWLLDRYDLQIGDPVTVFERGGIRLTARARRGERDAEPSIFPPFHFPRRVTRFEHVDAIVDAELGILLRCERRGGDRAASLTEFRGLTVNPVIDPARFTAPPGAVFGKARGPLGPFGPSFGGAGWEAAKAAGGLAAGGTGLALRYSPFGPFGPFGRRPPARPDEGDAKAAIPEDDSPPGEATDEAPPGDDLLHLLYRGGAGVPEFTATLHQWFDPARLLAAVPESARKAGFGGVGYLVDTLSDIARDRPATDHVVRDIRIAGWDRYRIDLSSRTPRPRGQRNRDPATIACDGQRRWQVYDDQVVIGPAGPPPAEITELTDGSWLLGCELSGGTEVTAGGRRAFRVRVVPPHWRTSSLVMFRFPAVALVDAETGRLLRLTSYARGKPVARHELRDVAVGHSGDFGFEPPPGLRVVEEGSDSGRPPGPVNPVGMAAKGAAEALKRRFGYGRGAPAPPGTV
jgi:hypothetical protein